MTDEPEEPEGPTPKQFINECIGSGLKIAGCDAVELMCDGCQHLTGDRESGWLCGDGGSGSAGHLCTKKEV